MAKLIQPYRINFDAPLVGQSNFPNYARGQKIDKALKQQLVDNKEVIITAKIALQQGSDTHAMLTTELFDNKGQSLQFLNSTKGRI